MNYVSKANWKIIINYIILIIFLFQANIVAGVKSFWADLLRNAPDGVNLPKDLDDPKAFDGLFPTKDKFEAHLK